MSKQILFTLVLFSSFVAIQSRAGNFFDPNWIDKSISAEILEDARVSIGEKLGSQQSFSILGKLGFESRFTRSIEGVGAQIYWVPVVYVGSKTYFLAHRFHPGKGKAPTGIDLDGSRLQVGSLVKLEGRGVPINSEQVLFTHIQKVVLVMRSGWDCYTLNEADPSMNIRVWYQPLTGNRGGYKMALSRRQEDHSYHREVVLDEVDLTVQGEQIIFAGRNSDNALNLSIRQQSSQVRDLESLLTILATFREDGKVSVIESKLVMQCNPDR